MLTRKIIPSLLFIFIPLSGFAQDWSQNEIEKISSFSLKNLENPADPSNKYLHDPAVISFGKALFNDTRFSSNKKISCASCHIESSAFTDNRNLAVGLRQGFRNTPSLLNAAQHNWFFADGAKDSLWAQVLSSLENPAEQNFSRIELLHLIASDQELINQYELLFKNRLPSREEINKLPAKAGPNAKLAELISWKKLTNAQKHITNRVFVDIGKAIAAYVSTIKSEPTRFDLFVEELTLKGISETLNDSENRGLKLFTGVASGCSNCHSGPLFTNKEFHNIGTGIPAKDNGRSEVIESVIRDEFNCLGKYSDAKPDQCVELKYINRNKHSLSGAFKTSSLRGIKYTAPYMHDGRYMTLNEVMDHYTRMGKLPRQTDLTLIDLSKDQKADIVNFLMTL